MAAYQGARPSLGLALRTRIAPRGMLAPGSLVPVPDALRSDTPPADAALPRRRVRSSAAVRAGRRTNRVGILLGGIVVAFLLAFFSLAQTMRVSAIAYEVDRLGVERDRLEAQLLDLRSDVNRLSNEPAIRKQALDAGLSQLGTRLVVDPR
jgi:hypothetical protein